MSGPDAMHSEMSGFSHGRPGGEREPLLDMIFDRRPLPPGAPPEMHDLARMLAIAAGPAEPGELTGEATALAAFARLASPVGVSSAASRPTRRRLTRRPARARLPLVAALVTAAAGLGSMTAAYVGVLPTPIQHLAHVAMGAPAPDHGDSQGSSGLTSTHSRMVTPVRGTSTPRPSRSAAETSAPGGVDRAQPGGLRPRRRFVGPTCTPRAEPAQNLVTPSPSPARTLVTPSPAKNVVTPSPSATKAVTPGASQSAAASGGSAGLPQASASAGCQASATEIVIPPTSLGEVPWSPTATSSSVGLMYGK